MWYRTYLEVTVPNIWLQLVLKYAFVHTCFVDVELLLNILFRVIPLTEDTDLAGLRS